MKLRVFAGLALTLCACATWSAPAPRDAPMAYINAQIAAHPGQSGAYVLDAGNDALLARAWLADHAGHSIDVQYFIWSTDNVGILAAESLLRAADRGVNVRVIVDDLLIDAPDKSLLALARHPRIDIRIYNPTGSVGVPLQKRLLNAVSDFRGVNQRMHNKTFIVDGRVAITGGRNLAAEYYGYNHEYNFRDRDALLLGNVVGAMQASFETFWSSDLSVPVENRYDGLGLLKRHVTIDDAQAASIYRELHEYARAPENFTPQIHSAIAAMPASFEQLAGQLAWGEAEFISDLPGKNQTHGALGGGGLTTAALARLVQSAQQRVVIQSPYLVMSDAALDLFRQLRKRGVRVRINTNSLAATDNLPAYSGYRSQRAELLKMGLEIYEYRPDAQAQRKRMARTPAAPGPLPVCALHAKTLVVDGRVVFIGTFNFDPRSENLNTEVGVILRDPALAAAVEADIERDMSAANSWNAATDDPDQYVNVSKRAHARLLQMLPIRPLL